MERTLAELTPIQAAAADFLCHMSRIRNASAIFVIACSKAKSANRQAARTLYRSGRFQVQRRIAEALSPAVYVLSAKHGIVELDQELNPYDLTFPHGIFEENATILNLDALPKNGASQTLVFFGGNRYLTVLRRQLAPFGIAILAPFEHLSSYATALWCRVVEDALIRRARGKEFYDLIVDATKRSGLNAFKDFTTLRTLPERGVYYFFDPHEPTAFSQVVPRIVRIGTHAVSIGSKATLRTRLRAHFGQRDLSGNHRASIFRLHVGNALLTSRDDHALYPDWGRGMSAELAVRRREQKLEVEVSNYLSRLLFSFVELPDASAKTSQRSQLERASINFLGADYVPLEEPTADWLGRSAKPYAIRQTGLWNIQHNGERYNRRDLRIIANTVFSPRMAGT